VRGNPVGESRNRIRLNRPAAGAILLLAALSVACGPAHQPILPSGPHPIIIIDIDTLRADHLGCYGYHRDTSPNIDALARESAFFEYAFAQAPNTPPSQTSFLTGLYPSTPYTQHNICQYNNIVILAVS